VCDEDNLLKSQLGDDGIELTDLTGSGIRIAGGFVGSTPPKKIKGNDSTWWER
jgi:hypothetical protein